MPPVELTDPNPVTALEFRVRYAETDQMGVVYHANYLVWCEMARTGLIRERGIPYADLERRGVLLAVAEASIRYHAPARYEDLIRAEAWIESVRSRTVSFGYRIFSLPDGGGAPLLLATAATTLVVLDAESRPRRLPEDVVDMLAGR